MALPRWVFDRLDVAPSVRTPVVAPIACAALSIENEDDVNGGKLWDAATGGNYKRLSPGGQINLTLPPGLDRKATGSLAQKTRRFDEGQTVVWIEADAGVGPIALEFIL
jgi:hypothetical protein